MEALLLALGTAQLITQADGVRGSHLVTDGPVGSSHSAKVAAGVVFSFAIQWVACGALDSTHAPFGLIGRSVTRRTACGSAVVSDWVSGVVGSVGGDGVLRCSDGADRWLVPENRR